MSWEQDPWSVPGGVYAPKRRVTAGRNRNGSRGHGNGGGLRWLWILAVCLVGYAAWGLVFGDHGIIHLRKLGAQEAALKGEIAKARSRVDELSAQAANIDQTRQNQARTKYGMARGDELIYQTQSADSAAAGVAGTTGAQGARRADNADRPDRP